LQAAWGSCEHIAIDTLPSPSGEHFQAMRSNVSPQAALLTQRRGHQRWWTASFSSLTRGLEAGTPQEESLLDADMDAQASHEKNTSQAALTSLGNPLTPATTSVSAWQVFPAGARYGSLLHDLLEWQAQQGWPLANTQPAAWQQQAWQQLVQRKAEWLQLPQEAQALLNPWLQAILCTSLPLIDVQQQPLARPLVLQSLQAAQLWPEMEFSLSAGHVPSAVLDQLIRQQVLVGQDRPSLLPQVMQGMLTGSMDLVFEHDGRYWVLDYKSNKLPGYQAAQLQEAVLDKRYDVQYVLYILALHRLLKSRLQDYDYDQHIGGAVYLFLRGIDAPNAGVHAMRPPFELIHQIDQLFAEVAA
jgi:exodeoxyribonuclease V beta subunit